MEEENKMFLTEQDKEDLKKIIKTIYKAECKGRFDRVWFFDNFDKDFLLHCITIICEKLLIDYCQLSCGMPSKNRFDFSKICTEVGSLPLFLRRSKALNLFGEERLILSDIFRLHSTISELMDIHHMRIVDLKKPIAPLVTKEEMERTINDRLRYLNLTISEELNLRQERDQLLAEIDEKWRQFRLEYDLYKEFYFKETAEGRFRDLFYYADLDN